VVSGTDHDRRVLRDGRRGLACNPRESGSERLDPSQTTRRLEETPVQIPRLLRRFPVSGLNLCGELTYAVFERHD